MRSLERQRSKETAEGTYPPVTDFSWIKPEDIGEENLAYITNHTNENLPDYNIRGMLKVSGRIEELQILSFLFSLAMKDLYETRKDFPMVNNVSSSRTTSAIASIEYVLTTNNIVEKLIVFTSNKATSIDEYAKARGMLLENVNSKLATIGRQPIPTQSQF